MNEVPFVDAHFHAWELTRIRYAWLTPPFADDGPNGSVEAIAKDYTIADYRGEMTRWNVVGAVHVDAGADPAQALDETCWLDGVAEANGLPSGIVAFAALDDPQVGKALARQAACPRVRGIRQIVNWHADPRRSYTPRDVTRDETWAAGFAALGRHALSFDLQCYPAQMPGLAPLLARHPDTPVVINHLGMPVLSDANGREEWRAGLRALAALPHVAIKISGLGFAFRPWTMRDARPLVLEAIDLFSPGRCLVASNFPTDRLFGSADATLGAYAEIIASFSDAERRAMWGGNANRIYRLGLHLQETASG